MKKLILVLFIAAFMNQANTEEYPAGEVYSGDLYSKKCLEGDCVNGRGTLYDKNGTAIYAGVFKMGVYGK